MKLLVLFLFSLSFIRAQDQIPVQCGMVKKIHMTSHKFKWSQLTPGAWSSADQKITFYKNVSRIHSYWIDNKSCSSDIKINDYVCLSFQEESSLCTHGDSLAIASKALELTMRK
jgi:hypothetical protein